MQGVSRSLVRIDRHSGSIESRHGSTPFLSRFGDYQPSLKSAPPLDKTWVWIY